MEIVGFGILLALLGGVFLLGALVLLPVYLLFKVLAFGVRLVFGVLGFLLSSVLAVVLLPFLLMAGALIAVKVLFLLALPVMVLGLVLWGLFAVAGTAAA